MKIGEYNRRLARDKTVFYVVVVFVAALVVFAACICLIALQGVINKMGEEVPHASAEMELPAKPLPDFIVDKVEPNELEQLKP